MAHLEINGSINSFHVDVYR